MLPVTNTALGCRQPKECICTSAHNYTSAAVAGLWLAPKYFCSVKPDLDAEQTWYAVLNKQVKILLSSCSQPGIELGPSSSSLSYARNWQIALDAERPFPHMSRIGSSAAVAPRHLM